MTLYQPHPAGDIFEAEAHVAFVQFFKVGLDDAAAIVVDAHVKFTRIGILGKVNKAGIAVFEDIVDQLLHHAEDDEFLFFLEPGFVFVKTAAGIDAAGAGYFLEQVVYGRFEPEILEGGGHQVVADIADELDGIVYNLPGLEDGLELDGLIVVNQVFIQVQAHGGQQGAGIVVQVGGQALAFFFLQLDGGVEQDFLLVLFHLLYLFMKEHHTPLVQDDEDDQGYRKHHHAHRA